MHICIDMWFMVDRSEISDIIHWWYNEYHRHKQVAYDKSIRYGRYIYGVICYEYTDAW
jgi:predicted metal-dependent hydrolase